MSPLRLQTKSVDLPHPALATTNLLPLIAPQPDRVVTVLAISPCEEDHRSLRDIFRRSRWSLFHARTCQEAVEFLRLNRIAVIITESELEDRCWKDVLGRVASSCPPAPRVVVSSRKADDELWSQALNLGAYNVLAKPFDEQEVFWVVSHAWLDWKSEWERQFRPAPLSLRATA